MMTSLNRQTSRALTPKSSPTHAVFHSRLLDKVVLTASIMPYSTMPFQAIPMSYVFPHRNTPAATAAIAPKPSPNPALGVGAGAAPFEFVVVCLLSITPLMILN